MDKRDFIKTSLFGVVGLLSLPALAKGMFKSIKRVALSPAPMPLINNYLSEESIQLHYKLFLNAAERLNISFNNLSEDLTGIKDILRNPKKLDPEVIRNGGIYLNHKIFFKTLTPKGIIKPEGAILSEIISEFGSFEKFQHQFEELSLKKLGNGWTWLIVQNNKLKVTYTKDDENPFMSNIPRTQQGYPIMGLDLCEHSYMPDYNSNSADYVKGFWEAIDWQFVSMRYKRAITSTT